jgi:hypothetical protein
MSRSGRRATDRTRSRDPPSPIVLTDSQFENLRELLQSYLKVVAIGAVREISEKELERNTRLLNSAGFGQKEIAKILHSSQPTISRILAGSPAKQRWTEEAGE